MRTLIAGALIAFAVSTAAAAHADPTPTPTPTPTQQAPQEWTPANIHKAICNNAYWASQFPDDC